MQFGNRVFAPGIWPTIATVLIFPLLVSLGFWQLERAEQKRKIYVAYQEQLQGKPVVLEGDLPESYTEPAFMWRKVKATGRFNETTQILLDNQVMDKQAGYFVYTPFQITDDKRWVLVNRGWVSAGEDRSVMPEMNKTQGNVSISGVIKQPQGTGIRISENTIQEFGAGVYRVNNIEIEKLRVLLNLELLSYVIRLDRTSDHGYKRNWPQPGSGEHTHLGYAFQWFMLAGLLFIIFIAVNLKRVNGEPVNDE